MTPTDLTTLRRKLKLTQVSLAERLGISDRTIRRYENGKTIPLPIVKMLAMIDK